MNLVSGGPERFDVWAPDAGSVTLLADGRQYPMVRKQTAPGTEGWWAAPDAPADGEVDYGYLLDGDATPLPDPRSRRLPAGVHQLSRTFDPAAYDWQDAGWAGRELQGSVIYELHIGTFTPEGTLDAAAAKLAYLADLGVDFVELLPVNGFNGTHNWGYDGVQWYAVHEGYGGPAAYQRFVDAAHAAGLGGCGRGLVHYATQVRTALVEQILDPGLGGVVELDALGGEELDAVVAVGVVGGGDDRSEVEAEPANQDRRRRSWQDAAEQGVPSSRGDAGRQRRLQHRARLAGVADDQDLWALDVERCRGGATERGRQLDAEERSSLSSDPVGSEELAPRRHPAPVSAC